MEIGERKVVGVGEMDGVASFLLLFFLIFEGVGWGCWGWMDGGRGVCGLYIL